MSDNTLGDLIYYFTKHSNFNPIKIDKPLAIAAVSWLEDIKEEIEKLNTTVNMKEVYVRGLHEHIKKLEKENKMLREVVDAAEKEILELKKKNTAGQINKAYGIAIIAQEEEIRRQSQTINKLRQKINH